MSFIFKESSFIYNEVDKCCLLPSSLPSGSSANLTARAPARAWWGGIGRWSKVSCTFFGFKDILNTIYIFIKKISWQISCGFWILAKFGSCSIDFKITLLSQLFSKIVPNFTVIIWYFRDLSSGLIFFVPNKIDGFSYIKLKVISIFRWTFFFPIRFSGIFYINLKMNCQFFILLCLLILEGFVV